MNTESSPSLPDDRERNTLSRAKKEIEAFEMDWPLLSEEEAKKVNDNSLALIKYQEGAYRIHLSINKPENRESVSQRLASFDSLMNKVKEAGVPVYHHSGPRKGGEFSNHTYWEFMTKTGTENQESLRVSQSLVLEICEDIANKVGVELSF